MGIFTPKADQGRTSACMFVTLVPLLAKTMVQ